MKFKGTISFFASLLLLNSCWIGDRDDVLVEEQKSLIEVLCHTPETRTFCDLIYKTPVFEGGQVPGARIVPYYLGTTQIGGNDPNTGQRCLSGVETVFAPTNAAFDTWLQGFPQWETIDDIPLDTVFLIVKHHIYLKGKLFIENASPVCTEQQIVPGNANPYNMWEGRWIFARNVDGDIAPLSLQTFNFASPIFSPDISTKDGALYVIDQVLGPF